MFGFELERIAPVVFVFGSPSSSHFSAPSCMIRTYSSSVWHTVSERASEHILVLATYTPHRRRFLVFGQGAGGRGEGFLAISRFFSRSRGRY